MVRDRGRQRNREVGEINMVLMEIVEGRVVCPHCNRRMESLHIDFVPQDYVEKDLDEQIELLESQLLEMKKRRLVK